MNVTFFGIEAFFNVVFACVILKGYFIRNKAPTIKRMSLFFFNRISLLLTREVSVGQKMEKIIDSDIFLIHIFVFKYQQIMGWRLRVEHDKAFSILFK